MMPAMTSYRTESVAVGDGTFDLHLWLPPAGRGPGIVLLQEIFGVGSFVRAVGERLAGLGYVAGAPDLFWRFAPGFAAAHDEVGIAEAFAMLEKLDREAAVTDSIAALEHLATLDEVTGRPGVMGYCLGGRLAWAVAGRDAPSVCVSYYGSGVPDMLDLVEQVSCPTLFHFGDADAYIPMEGVEKLNAAITGKPGFAINVEHGGHAFENSDAPMFYDEAAAQSSWAKTAAFLAANLPPG
jgi:carboxymethylenebutenolidase